MFVTMRTTHPTPLHIAAGFAVALCVGAGANWIISLSSGGPVANAVGPLSQSSNGPDAAPRGRLLEQENRAGSAATVSGGRAETVVTSSIHSADPRFESSAGISLLDAIIHVESRGRPDAIGDGGRAVGVLQIWPVMVDDCNRIAPGEHFTLADRYSPERSRAMFRVFVDHYCDGDTDEQIARKWNGGPAGDRKAATVGYWKRVEEAMR